MTKLPFEIDEVGSDSSESMAGSEYINRLLRSWNCGVTFAIDYGGKLDCKWRIKIRPHLVKQDKEEISSTRVISQQTSLKMRQLMRLVVSHGTARKAEVAGYEIEENGTAEKMSMADMIKTDGLRLSLEHFN